MEDTTTSKDNLLLTDEAVKILNKPIKKQLPEIKILDWNYLNRQINLEWYKQKADMQGVTFSEFKTTCLAHIRNQLYAGVPINEIMIGKTMSEIEKGFAEQLIDKIEKEIKKEQKKKEDEEIVIETSFLNHNNFIAEQVRKDNKNLFCIYNFDNNSISYEEKINDDSITYIPINAEEVIKKAIGLPSEALEYGIDENLDNELKEFITKWLDIPDDILQFAIWNIKRSWIYEKFHTLNYLRALGDTGTGKTRYLDVLGSLHYKPIATSGATTSAPVFRIIEKWKGTLIMDEADFDKSDEAQDIIKIINQGYERGKYVMRCDKDNNNKINFFDPYCPKILATRKTFTDKAVESRCITYVMRETTRKDIKYNLNNEFENKVLELRNKLLMWRFRNWNNINPNNEVGFDLGDLEPRVKQIVTSFISMFNNNQQQLEKFKEFITNYQEELIDERKSSFNGSVVECIYDLISEGNLDISAYDIIIKGGLTDFKGNPMKPRGLTSTLKSLAFEKTTSKRIGEKTKRVIPLNKEHLTNLFKRYGYDVTVVTVVWGTGKQQIIKEFDQKEGGVGHPIHRNNRNTVTTVTDENVNPPLHSEDITLKKPILENIDYPTANFPCQFPTGNEEICGITETVLVDGYVYLCKEHLKKWNNEEKDGA